VADGLSAGVPPEAATSAQDTLGGAVSVAGQLPSELGTPLLQAANEAFVQGVHVSAAISAIGALALAVFTWVFICGREGLRTPRASSPRAKSLNVPDPHDRVHVPT
jgi:MFS transporter, DHA2 family, multidrug resistance protein